MPKLPVITPRKLLKVLLRVDFYIHHQSGSHVNLKHHTKNHLHIVVPIHSRDLAPKTLKSVLQQAEITVEDFVDLM